ncbi:MAG: translocation/assembly module TamB domain-containing protein, partial [bacterium]
LQGDGPLADWRGELHAGIERYGTIDARLALRAETGIALQAEGAIRPASGPIPVDLQALAGDTLQLALAARWDGASSWSVDSLRLETPVPVIELSGNYDSKAGLLSSHAAVHIDDLSSLAPLTRLNLAGAAAVSATVSGPIHQPEADVQIHLDKPRVADVSMDHFRTALRIVPLEPFADALPPLRITAEGQGSDWIHHATPAFHEKQLSWSFEGIVDTSPTITIQNLEMRGTDYETRIAGTADFAIASASLTIDGAVGRLQRFKELINTPLEGSLQFRVDLEGHSRNRSLVSTFHGTLKNLNGLSGLPAALAGPAIDWRGRAVLSHGNELSIPSFQMKSTAGSITGNATADLSKKNLNAQWEFSLPQLAAFPLWPEYKITGSVSGEGQAQGPWPDAELVVRLQTRNLLLDGISPGQAAVSLRAKNVAHHPQGDLRITLEKNDHALTLATGYLYQPPLLELSRLSLTGPSLEIEGEAQADLKRRLIQGHLRGGSQDLSTLGEWIGEPLRGAITLDAVLDHALGRQSLQLQGNASGLESRWGRLGGMKLDTRLEDVFTAPHGTLAIAATAGQRDELKVDSLNFNAHGVSARGEWKLAGQGEWRRPFHLTANGAWEVSKIRALEIETLNAAYGNIPIILERPARWELHGNTLSLDGILLRAESATLSSSGQMNPGRIGWEISLDGFPLECLSSAGLGGLAGTLRSHIHITGSPGTPILQGQAQGSHLRLANSTREQAAEAVLEATASYARGTFWTEAQVTHLVEKPIAATLEFPLELSLRPFLFRMVPSGALQGQITGEVDLATIPDLLSLEDQKLAGQLTSHFTIAGTMEQPAVSGTLTVENGSYDHLELGTVIRNLHLRLEAEGHQLRLADGRFNDGGNGAGSLGGQIMLEPDLPLSLEIRLNQATLARRDDVTATTSGTVNLTGSLREPTIAGQLTVAPVEVGLDEPLPVEIRNMEIITIEEENPEANRPAPAPAVPALQAHLDLRLDFPNRLFIRGRGLDSEWQGNLNITGNLPRPAIQGKFSIVRGNFQFFGNRLSLPSGTVAFNGAYPPDPFMNLTAETTKKSTSFTLEITGSASAPEFNLQSNPPLPSDEVLSSLLFGRRINDITPLQAIQFAQAANALRGGRGVFDILGKTRNLLGLAQLELRQSEEEGMANTMVGIGKYITNDIYVDLQQGFQNDSSRVMVEIQLTPNIAIESELSVHSSSGIGVVFKYDF